MDKYRRSRNRLEKAIKKYNKRKKELQYMMDDISQSEKKKESKTSKKKERKTSKKKVKGVQYVAMEGLGPRQVPRRIEMPVLRRQERQIGMVEDVNDNFNHPDEVRRRNINMVEGNYDRIARDQRIRNERLIQRHRDEEAERRRRLVFQNNPELGIGVDLLRDVPDDF